MKIKINYLETCLPDYFCGSKHLSIAVPVSPMTTFNTLRQDIRDSISAIDIKLDFTSEELEKALDNLFDGIHDMDSIPTFCKWIDSVEPDIDDEAYEYPTIYSYFEIVEDKFIYRG